MARSKGPKLSPAMYEHLRHLGFYGPFQTRNPGATLQALHRRGLVSFTKTKARLTEEGWAEYRKLVGR